MTTTAIDNTEIKYDRFTKDYAVLVDGVAVAYGRNYSEAEAKRTAYLADRDADGLSATATERDGGAFCTTCGNDGDCPDCDPRPACKRDVLGDHWTVCRAPGDGPCYCDVVVRSISATNDKPGIETEPPEPPVYPQDNGKLLADIARVLDMALGNAPARDVIPQLRRIRARITDITTVCRL